MLDKAYNSDGFKVFVDQASLPYLDGVEVDFVDSSKALASSSTSLM